MQIDYGAFDKADLAELLENITAQLIKYELSLEVVTINDVYRYLKTKTNLVNKCGEPPQYTYYISCFEQPINDEELAFALLRKNKDNILFRSYCINGIRYREYYDEEEDTWKFRINGETYYA